MALDEGMTYSMPLEVYLQSAVVRGILGTNQDRLSNYFILREGDEVFSLKEATLETPDRKPVAMSSDEYLIYMQEVFLIADLSPQFRSERSMLDHLYVKKEASKALLGVGSVLAPGKYSSYTRECLARSFNGKDAFHSRN